MVTMWRDLGHFVKQRQHPCVVVFSLYWDAIVRGFGFNGDYSIAIGSAIHIRQFYGFAT